MSRRCLGPFKGPAEKSGSLLFFPRLLRMTGLESSSCQASSSMLPGGPGIRGAHGRAPQTDGARPGAQTSWEPPTRRGASSFSGTGRSTGERKIQDTEAALSQPGSFSRQGAAPTASSSTPRMQGGVRTGDFPQRTSLQLAIPGRRRWCCLARAEKMPFCNLFIYFNWSLHNIVVVFAIH